MFGPDLILGRPFDGPGECLAASAAHLAKTGGLQRIDQARRSGSSAVLRDGEDLLVVPGTLCDPGQSLACDEDQRRAVGPWPRDQRKLQRRRATQRGLVRVAGR